MKIHLSCSRTQNRNGETIIFLHAAGASGLMWHPVQAFLADYDCITPDLPGHGTNNHLPWISAKETAHLIAELIKQNANDNQAYLVGVGLGSIVGMELLANHPNIVKKALFCAMNVLPRTSNLALDAWAVLQTPFVGTKRLTKEIARKSGIPNESLDDFYQSTKNTNASAFRRASREEVRYTLPDNAERIRTPILIAAGGDENQHIHDSIHTTVNTVLYGVGYILPFYGVGWYNSEAELFAKLLERWFTDMPIPNRFLPIEETVEVDILDQ